MRGEAWTESETRVLAKARATGLPATEIAKRLEGRTERAVQHRVRLLGLQLKRRHRYDDQMQMRDIGKPPKECQFPIGDPQDEDFHFCGEPTVTGRPYCSEHMARAYTARFEEPEEDDDDAA